MTELYQTVYLYKSGEAYKKALKHFRDQYGDVVELRELHVNSGNEVYSGEWLDSKGCVHFCSGFLLDLCKLVKFR